MRMVLPAALFGAFVALSPFAAHAQAASDTLTVTLIAEPQATAPALYPGKPGVPLEGKVRMVAVVNARSALGKAVTPAALTYTWVVNDAGVIDASGTGKNALMVAAPLPYRAETVSVQVASSDGTLSGSAGTTLTSQNPTVLLYENDPLLGIRFEHTLSGTYTLASSEASLYAAPFSFPTVSGMPTITWFLNGAQAQSGNLITLRPAGNGAGSADLSLVVATDDFVKATAALGLSFTTSSSGFLGL